MRVFNKKIVTNAIMNTTINSPAIPLEYKFGYAIQAAYAGTPTGTIKLQASADPVISSEIGEKQPTHWNDIDDSSFVLASAGVTLWNVRDSMYAWVRVVYTDASGGASTAVLNVNINAKGG